MLVMVPMTLDPSEVLDKAQQATATTLDTIREPASQAFDAASEAASRAAGFASALW